MHKYKDFIGKIQDTRGFLSSLVESFRTASRERDELTNKYRHVVDRGGCTQLNTIETPRICAENHLSVLFSKTKIAVKVLDHDVKSAIDDFKKNPSKTAKEWQPDTAFFEKTKAEMDKERIRMLALSCALDVN